MGYGTLAKPRVVQLEELPKRLSLEPAGRELILIRNGHQFRTGPLLKRAAPCCLVPDFLYLFLGDRRGGDSPGFISANESQNGSEIFIVLNIVTPSNHGFQVELLTGDFDRPTHCVENNTNYPVRTFARHPLGAAQLRSQGAA